MACRQYAAAHGLSVVEELSEDSSGAVPVGEREKGRQLSAIIARREIDAVVVHQVDRLSRDIVDLLATVRDWLRAGVHVHAGDVGEIESELDIVLVIKGWQGSDERVKIRERTTRGKWHKARTGKVVGGRPPFGYEHLRDRDGRVVNFKIVESEAKVVRLIYELYLHGDGEEEPLAASAIARRLAETGIATPGEARGYNRKRGPAMWGADAVSRILKKEAYAGVWHYGVYIGGTDEQRPEDSHATVEIPAIVERATWESIQKRKVRNKKMAKRNRKRDYLLSGLIRCGCRGMRCVVRRSRRFGATMSVPG